MHLSMVSPRVGGGGGYPREIDSESLPLSRNFDTKLGIWHARHLGRPREPGDDLHYIRHRGIFEATILDTHQC